MSALRLSLRSSKLPVLLGLFCFLLYNANLRQIGSGDTIPARYLPLILWHSGTLELDANARIVAHGYSMLDPRNRPAGVDKKVNYLEPGAYWLVRTREHRLASFYPIVTSLLVAPLYLPAVLWLDAHGWEQPQLDRVAEIMEKLSASLIASLTVVLMFLLLRRENARWSLPLALVFAFGTNTWVISSQALWQHGTGEFLITLALLLVVSRASPARSALLGAVCVLITANRPPDGLIAVALVLYAFWNLRSKALWILVGAALPLAAVLDYNLAFMGNLAGGYGMVKVPATFFRPIWKGLPGLLVSPGRGLLVFSPFFVFLPLGLWLRLRTPASRGLALALGIAVLAQLLFYSMGDWRAGVSWGPRWLTDILPILIWMLAPVASALRPRARAWLILAMAVSVGIQTVGAFWYNKTSDARIFSNPASMRGAWNPRNLPFLVELRHSHAHGDLRWDATGGVRQVGETLLSNSEVVPILETGSAVDGWVNTTGGRPFRLWVLIDGIEVGWTAEFQREGKTSPYLWRISANTAGVAPGEHLAQLAVTFETGGNIRILREQRVRVVAPEPSLVTTTPSLQPVSDQELQGMAKRAATLVRGGQSAEGFWLTAFTSGLKYEATQPEMNTFLTSFMVDTLSPVARQHALEDVLQRARRHLAAQIEANGLVRYHGLPNAPGIGRIGCVITPDSDDSALAWRIAGNQTGDPRLHLMLAELARYRDARGLYRTWLAPPKQYQNLDIGNDPDPTDICINLNIYLMLRELDPPAAENLCAALQRSFRDNDLWVYYSQAPLLVYLRCAELRQLGCVLPLPSERLALPSPGQEIWSEVAIRLVGTMGTPPDPEVRQSIRSLLGRIGKDDFAILRSSPPLLYHNDMTASVKRFYWSEEFGYALWLRLYEATALP